MAGIARDRVGRAANSSNSCYAVPRYYRTRSITRGLIMDNLIDATKRFSMRRLDADVARINAEPEAQAKVDAFVDALFLQHQHNRSQNVQGQ